MSEIKSQYLLLSSLKKKNPNEFSLVKEKSMFKFQANLIEFIFQNTSFLFKKYYLFLIDVWFTMLV